MRQTVRILRTGDHVEVKTLGGASGETPRQIVIVTCAGPPSWVLIKLAACDIPRKRNRLRSAMSRQPGLFFRPIRTIPLFICYLTIGALWLCAQYTDRTAMQDLGGPKEFEARRAELAQKLKTGYVLLFAKTQAPQADHYREDNDFYYYIGLSDPGAIMLMDVEKQKTTIFEPQQGPRGVQVYGPNLLSLSKDQQKELGYAAVLPLNNLDGALAFLFGDGVERDLWVRLGFATRRMAHASRLDAITRRNTTILTGKIFLGIETPSRS